MLITLALYLAITVTNIEPVPIIQPTPVVQVYDNRKISEEDFELLCSITWAEMGNEGELAQMACASVILNRVDSNQYPNTIKKVIYQGNGSQFNGIRRDNFGYYTIETEIAVNKALKENLFQSDVTLFSNPSISTDLNFVENVLLPNQVMTIGKTVFAREPRK